MQMQCCNMQCHAMRMQSIYLCLRMQCHVRIESCDAIEIKSLGNRHATMQAMQMQCKCDAMQMQCKWCEIQRYFGARYKDNLVQDTKIFWCKIQRYFGASYKDIWCEKVAPAQGDSYKDIRAQASIFFVGVPGARRHLQR